LTAPAQVTVNGATRPVSLLAAAQILIANGRYADARKVLDKLAGDTPNDPEVQFLLGLLDIQDKAYDSAVHHFRSILVKYPRELRVRLELARALFLEGNYLNAERQFRFARSGKIPASTVEIIDRYLAVIRQQKFFTYDLSVGIAPDTNINVAPAIRTVTLYGIPFELSDQARQHSGVGLITDIKLVLAPRLSRRSKLLIGAEIYRAQYGDTAFDDMTVTGYIGPKLTYRRWEFDILGTLSRRWYGDRVYVTTPGGALDATYYFSARAGLTGTLSVGQTNFAQNSWQTGPNVTGGLQAFFTLTSASEIRGFISMGHQDAKLGAYAYNQFVLGTVYTRELSHGITASVMPSYSVIAYEAPLAAFNAKRLDRAISAQISLLDRGINISGFTPKISYSHTINMSNIPVYGYHRDRIAIYLTKNF